jgi:stearoyl-CoA desaturase (delta-9 desaturase)
MTPFYLFFSSLSGIGGPLTWIKVHALRDHWQNQTKAPRALTYDNSLIHDFFINLHCRIYPKKDEHLRRLPKDLVNDSWVYFFEVTWAPLNLLFFFALWHLVDLQAAIWLVALRVCLAIIGHWLVGYIVHKWGYVSYRVEGASEEGRNSLFLGWLTFGEAYHNNHHKFPESASMGFKKYEFDLGYLCIQCLAALGLAKNIKLSDEHFSKKS